jgi:hypothetical protein
MTVTTPSHGTAGPLELMSNLDDMNTAITKLADGIQHFASFESPAEYDTRVLFRARTDLQINKLVSALLGSDTPTVTWKLQSGADLSALVDLTLPIVTSSVTAGDEDDGGNELTPWTGPDGNGEYYAASPNHPIALEVDGDALTEGTVGSLADDEWGWDAGSGGRVYLAGDPSTATVVANPDGYAIAADDFLVITVTATSGSPSQLLVSLELEPA